MIPKHQRENYERTDHLLGEVNALLVTIEEISYASDGGKAHEFVETLLRMAVKKMEAAVRSHSMEWVGLGGTSHDLTEAEITEAAGKSSN